ncbi:hypothetical protein [Citrobacter sp.]|uniref:hypothetical protein n=1 Tax=Citrobacter sp. TaxID=1896336 RepID=UPI003A8A3B67
MTALNKQAYRADGGDIGTGRLKAIADNVYGDEEKRWLAQRVLALLDELEKSQSGERQWKEAAERRGKRLTRQALEILKQEQRIAELEARKFKVEMPESFYPDGDIDAPLVVDELEVIAAIVDAGGKPVAFCKRCDREIDLTHRPDGSHYCHAPAVGIGVKRE